MHFWELLCSGNAIFISILIIGWHYKIIAWHVGLKNYLGLKNDLKFIDKMNF